MRILKTKRGISTIIAVLLMIVIAVAAAVITYVWIIGYLGATTSTISEAGQQGRISIDAVANTSSTVISMVVRNIGDIAVTPDKIYVNGFICSTTTGTGSSLATESSTTLTATIPSSVGSAWSPGTQYVVEVVNTDGSSAAKSWTCPS